MPGESVSTATRDLIIDRATDRNPTNNRIVLSARDYIENGPGRFINPTFASGVREIRGDSRLPRGQTISYAQLLGSQYGYISDAFLTQRVAQLYFDDGSDDFAAVTFRPTDGVTLCSHGGIFAPG